MAGGAAEPPITAYFTVESVRLLAFMWFSRASHTVGTPAVKVTRSFSNSSCRLAPSSATPGKTSLAPTRAAE